MDEMVSRKSKGTSKKSVEETAGVSAVGDGNI
jgi:hypothetical protein